MGRTMQWTGRATECEPPSKFGKNIPPDRYSSNSTTYAPTAGGTKFSLTYDVNGFLKVLDPMMVSSMRKEVQKSLINLKQIVESESRTRMQDYTASLAGIRSALFSIGPLRKEIGM